MVVKLATLEPTFPLAQMEALLPIRAHVAPATVLSIRAMYAWMIPSAKGQETSSTQLTVFEPVTRRFFGIDGETFQLFWA